MATTRITPIHVNKPWGAAQTIKRTTDYILNPDKTEGGTLITAFECDADIVATDFMLARADYQFNTGRSQGENEVLAYHVRQAFKPGEIDAKKAHQLGYELAMELTKANHASAANNS